MLGIIKIQISYTVTSSYVFTTSCTQRKKIIFGPCLPPLQCFYFSVWAFVKLCVTGQLKEAWWKKFKDFAGIVLEALVVGKNRGLRSRDEKKIYCSLLCLHQLMFSVRESRKICSGDVDVVGLCVYLNATSDIYNIALCQNIECKNLEIFQRIFVYFFRCRSCLGKAVITPGTQRNVFPTTV